MLDSQTQPTLGSGQVATTNNWDTVFAIDFKGVNDGIEAQAKYPKKICQPANADPDDADEEHLIGTISTWKLTGGSGHLLEMEMDIPTFTMQVEDEDETIVSVTRTNAKVTIQISLHTEMGQEESGLGGGTPVSFRFNPSNTLLSDRGVFPITVLSMSWPGSSGEQDLADDARLFMGQFFNRSDINDAFDHTFATVHINSRIADAEGETDFSWIAPTDTAYGVIAKDDAQGGGAFAVLCMTKQNVAPNHQNVSPEVLGDARAGFLINKPMFLEHMIQPGLAAMFGREVDDDTFIEENFVIDTDSITNSETLALDEFEVRPTKGSTEKVMAIVPKRSFSISMLDTRLVINFNGLHHPYFKRVWYLYEAYHYYTIQAAASFDPATRKFGLVPVDADGDKAVSYRAALEKSVAGKVVDIALLVLDILAVVGTVYNGAKVLKNGVAVAANAEAVGPILGSARLGRIATSLRDFFVKPIVGLSFSILAGAGGIAFGLIKEAYENAREDDPENIKPDMQTFATKVLAPVVWPEGTGLEVTQVAFNGGLHITGNPDFTSEPSS
ncbi:MAG: TULIP family P47-like protein [Pseudomonadota bacterium]